MLSDKQPSLVSAPSNRYRPEINGLRAFAVIAVIINHFNKDLLPNGFLGVDIFFVISGYVITASLANREHESLGDLLLGFYARRVKRLMPALIVCVAITCVFGFLFIPPAGSQFNTTWQTGISGLFGLSNLYLLKKSTDYFAASTELNLFTQTWSLGVEEQFYLIFPFFLWSTGFARSRSMGKRNLLLLMTLLSFVSLSLYVWLCSFNQSAAYFQMPSRFWELGIGCITFLVLQSGEPLPKIFKFASPFLIVLLLIGILFIPQLAIDKSTIGVVALTSLLIATLSADSCIYRLFTWQPFAFIGLISYSLYLWHWSVLSISRWTIGIQWWTVPIQVGLILLLAIVSYKYVEQPLRSTQWSKTRILTIASGLGASLACAGLLLGLGKPFKGFLYTGKEAALIQNGVESLTQQHTWNGRVAWSSEACALTSDNEVGKTIEPDSCTFGSWNNSKTRFLVIGNSFSAAEIEMYKVLVESDLGSVTVTSSWGASPVQEIPNHSSWSKANDYYWNSVVPNLISQLRAGDVVIMINDIAGLAPAYPTRKTDQKLKILSDGLDKFADNLSRRNIGVIFQSSNPFMRESNCSPDSTISQWFQINKANVCNYYTKKYSLTRRMPLTQTLISLETKNTNFVVLDLFDVFCPKQKCSFFNERGEFMYRDEFSHPSIEGSKDSRSKLLSVVNDLMQSKRI